MPTIVSFYQRFPNEAPPLNLSAFDRTGYTYAENFRRNERYYEAEQCEVTSDDGSVVLSLDVRIRPRGGEIEALPRVMLSVYSEGMMFQVRRMELRTGGYDVRDSARQRAAVHHARRHGRRLSGNDGDSAGESRHEDAAGSVGCGGGTVGDSRRADSADAAPHGGAEEGDSPLLHGLRGIRHHLPACVPVVQGLLHKSLTHNLLSLPASTVCTCGRVFCALCLTKNRQMHILKLRRKGAKKEAFFMFNNIGHKIQVLAKVLCWIGIICWVITGLALMAGGSSMTYRLNGEFVRANSGAGVVAGIMTIIVGVLVSWIGSFLLYGFGQLVEDTHAIRANTESKKDA